MSDRDPQPESDGQMRRQDWFGLGLGVVGVFFAASILFSMWGWQPSERFAFLLAPVLFAVLWLGHAAGLLAGLGAAILGAALFLSPRDLRPGRHLGGIAGAVLGLSVLAGGLWPGAGGEIGTALPETLPGFAGTIVAALAGAALLLASLWIPWGGGELRLPALPRVAREPRRDTSREREEGVSAAEAAALVPAAPDPAAAGARRSSLPKPYQDVRLRGGIPAGTRPLETGEGGGPWTGRPAAPAPAPAPAFTPAPVFTPPLVPPRAPVPPAEAAPPAPPAGEERAELFTELAPENRRRAAERSGAEDSGEGPALFGPAAEAPAPPGPPAPRWESPVRPEPAPSGPELGEEPAEELAEREDEAEDEEEHEEEEDDLEDLEELEEPEDLEAEEDEEQELESIPVAAEARPDEPELPGGEEEIPASPGAPDTGPRLGEAAQGSLFDLDGRPSADLPAALAPAGGDEPPAPSLAATPAEEETAAEDYVLHPPAPARPAAPRIAGEEPDLEELIQAAGLLVLEENRVAVSLLERGLGVDFDRACQILDVLQERGLIGPYLGGRTREILLTREEWLAAVNEG
ncbi:MAG: DNA translocase FtsK [Planctomycetota bacterium]